MAKLTLAKNLHLCFSMLKRPHPQLTTTTATATTTTAPPHSPPRTAAFVKSYNSLFETTATATSSEDADMADMEVDVVPTTPDLTAAYASRRFFFTSPGRSNSIVDSLELSGLEEEPEGPAEEEADVVAGGVAVQTYSPDPYADFRRSMEEMVAARELKRVEDAWEYLQELLLSYLALNPKSTHKYIVGAFADLVFSLLSPHDHLHHDHDHHHNHDDHDSDDLDRNGGGVDGSTSLSSESSSCCGSSGGEIMEHE